MPDLIARYLTLIAGAAGCSIALWIYATTRQSSPELFLASAGLLGIHVRRRAADEAGSTVSA